MKKPYTKEQRKKASAKGGRNGRGESQLRSIKGLPRTPEFIHAYYVAIGRAAGRTHTAKRLAREKAREEQSNSE